jgi:hypothetical protein
MTLISPEESAMHDKNRWGMIIVAAVTAVVAFAAAFAADFEHKK